MANVPIAFTAHFAVYKATMDSGAGRTTCDHWVGYLADRENRKVAWEDGTTTEYGGNTILDPKFYSDECLAQDLAAGQLLYQAVAALMQGQKAPTMPATASASVTRAINKAEKWYKAKAKAKTKQPPKMPPLWLDWLQGCITLATTTGKPFHLFLALIRVI